MSEIKLLTCPFCYGIAKLENTHRMWDGQLYLSTHIECKVCGAKSKEVWNTQYNDKPNEREKEVIDRWNKRKPIQEIVKKLEKELLENPDDYVKDYRSGLCKAIEITWEVGGMNELSKV